MTRRSALAASTAAALAGSAEAQMRPKPLIYGHRGASALRPEHTLASYAKAIADGADFIEPDLVSTQDGVLIARHEPDISETTDVAAHPEFASRRTTKSFDGRQVTGWFTTDFTLDEMKTLRCKERLGASLRPESASYDGAFQIVTWEEMIDFAAAESAARGRLIGLVPELKSSAWHKAQGHPIDERFLDVTFRHGYTRRAALHVQSFEIDNLKVLRAKLGRPSNLALVQLVGTAAERPQDHLDLTYGQMFAPAGLKTMAAYADVVAPQLHGVIPVDAAGRRKAPTSLVADAHAAGLKVVVWTFRPENPFLPADLRAGAPTARNEAGSVAEMRAHIALGIDGFFTDDPALGRRAVDGIGA